MIFSKQLGFMFLRVPKTASTSIAHSIREKYSLSKLDIFAPILTSNYNPLLAVPKVPFNSKPLLKPNSHFNINQLICLNLITLDELIGINVYGVIRDPIDRIISCAKHRTQKEGNLGNEQAVERLLYLTETDYDKNCVLYKPQTHWLIHDGVPINKIFKYENVNQLVNEITGSPEIKYTHRSELRPDKSKLLSTELKNAIQIKFKSDFDLWESLP